MGKSSEKQREHEPAEGALKSTTAGILTIPDGWREATKVSALYFLRFVEAHHLECNVLSPDRVETLSKKEKKKLLKTPGEGVYQVVVQPVIGEHGVAQGANVAVRAHYAGAGGTDDDGVPVVVASVRVGVSYSCVEEVKEAPMVQQESYVRLNGLLDSWSHIRLLLRSLTASVGQDCKQLPAIDLVMAGRYAEFLFPEGFAPPESGSNE